MSDRGLNSDSLRGLFFDTEDGSDMRLRKSFDRQRAARRYMLQNRTYILHLKPISYPIGCLKKELCNCIPNVNCMASVTKTFTLKGVQTNHHSRCQITENHLDYHCKELFETPCITSGSHIEPYLSQIKLCVFYYIMTV
jgi:hypothetical protein